MKYKTRRLVGHKLPYLPLSIQTKKASANSAEADKMTQNAVPDQFQSSRQGKSQPKKKKTTIDRFSGEVS